MLHISKHIYKNNSLNRVLTKLGLEPVALLKTQAQNRFSNQLSLKCVQPHAFTYFVQDRFNLV